MKKVIFLALFLAPALASAASVDLLYQGETYVPPFYLGAPLWSGESMVRFIAIPQGLGNPATLNYKWTKGGTVLGDLSGVGRSTLRFKDSVFSKPQTVEVEIVNAADDTLASAFLSVVPEPSELLIYEKNPLYGFLFNDEVGQAYRLSEQEVTFAAFPLFFSSLARDGSLTYSWRSSAGEDSAASAVTYRTPDNSKGEANVSVKATNPATLRQAVSRDFLVQFGND